MGSLLFWAALGIALALSNCNGKAEDSAQPADSPSPMVLPQVSRPATTSSKIALRNLDAQIREAERLRALRPNDVPVTARLVDLLMLRVQVRGTFDDLDAARDLAEELGDDQRFSQTTKAHRLQAQAAVWQAVHLFDRARAAIEAASTLPDAPSEGIATSLALLDVAQGANLAAAQRILAGQVKKHASFRSFSQLAIAEAALGHFEQADAYFRHALAHYRDASPFPVAWIDFQRGLMWAEMAGQPGVAEPLYREAVARVPEYVVAQVHLAELEHERGKAASARARLRPLRQAQDPEPRARLAGWLRASDPELPELRRSVEEDYARLLEKHPEAFYEHAAEYALAADQPQEALHLATENLENRPNARAYQLAIEAADAAGNRPLHCNLLRQAQPLVRRYTPLADALAEAPSRCDGFTAAAN